MAGWPLVIPQPRYLRLREAMGEPHGDPDIDVLIGGYQRRDLRPGLPFFPALPDNDGEPRPPASVSTCHSFSTSRPQRIVPRSMLRAEPGHALTKATENDPPDGDSRLHGAETSGRLQNSCAPLSGR